jgi:voltage-gated potassium channel
MADNRIPLKKRIDGLYHGSNVRARMFRYGLLIFDLATILFFIVSSISSEASWIYVADFVIGTVILTDLTARFWIERDRSYFLTRFTTWADGVVVATLMLPFFLDSLLFLRVLRALRLLRSYHVLRDLRQEYVFFQRNEEVIQSVINLAVFIFVVTALVYVLQVRSNPDINNYIDALYFTVTTLTTTGFGDITLHGSTGRLLSVLIMVAGVALFLRLLQTIFRPSKVRYKCPDCGLSRHDSDAIHCKHCGRIVDIETEGGV